ncbi:O-antigen ligase family protein [Candidatus Uhrbacteria bacterium]|nr:O-antigen ligase family protein [Candidatus Uhrbacteria bacterium]
MQKVIELLIALLIFLIPWQARWVIRAGELNGSFWEYGTIAVYTTDILFLVILLLIGILVIQQRRLLNNPSSPPLTLRGGMIGLLFVGYLVGSIFLSPDKLVAVYTSIKLFEGIGLFFLLKHFWSGRTYFDFAFIVSAVVQSVLAIAQFFTQSVFAWPWSGIAAKDASALGVAVVQFADERWLRAYGTLPHPNILGGFLALALIILIAFWDRTSPRNLTPEPHPNPLLRGEGERVEERENVSRRGGLYLFVICSLVLTTGLFFTFSRAAWIAAIIGIIVWLIAARAWRDQLTRQVLILLTAYCFVLTALFWPLVATRLSNGERLEQRSTIERTQGYREAWQLFKAHPILGVGIGNYTNAVHDELRPNDPAWSYQPVHNVFVLILAELGVLGFLLFITPFVPRILRGRWSESIGFLSIVILMSLDHSFWTLHSGILILWAFLALYSVVHRDSTEQIGSAHRTS